MDYMMCGFTGEFQLGRVRGIYCNLLCIAVIIKGILSVMSTKIVDHALKNDFIVLGALNFTSLKAYIHV